MPDLQSAIEVLLARLGQLNTALAVAVLVVMLLRRPVRKFFGAQTAYGFWLLVPVAALATLLPSRTVQLVLTTSPSPLLDATSFDLGWLLLFWTWTLGFLILLHHLANAQKSFDDAVLDGEAGPAVAGFLDPKIVIPDDFASRYTHDEQAAILAHEEVHLRRQDARLNAVAALLRCICWFNPLVHIGARLMRVDQEMACDALALARHPGARRVYAHALLKTQMTDQALPVGCYWPGGGDHPLTERIEMLTAKRPKRARRLVGVGMVLSAAILSGWSAWAAQPVRVEVIVAPKVFTPPQLESIAPLKRPDGEQAAIARSLQAFESDMLQQQQQAAINRQLMSQTQAQIEGAQTHAQERIQTAQIRVRPAP